jgi:RimJ/RimL family protein N-acetyltransferase
MAHRSASRQADAASSSADPVAFTASAAGVAFGFRALAEADLPLLHRWLNAPHVVAGYTRVPMTLDEVTRKYRPRIAGSDAVRGHLVLLDTQPIGYVQTYRPSDGAELPAVTGHENAIAMDLLIGEVEYTQRGLGPRVIEAALATLVWSDPEVERCLAGIRPDHSASLRAFRKAGFEPVVTVQTVEGEAELVMERRRP